MLTTLRENILLSYSLYFVVVVGFSLLINTLFLRFVKTLGIRNADDDTVIRWSSKSKPAVGGFSFYISFLLSVISFSILFDSQQVFLSPEFVGMLLATLLGFLLGLTDDAYNTKPVLKFITQLSCGFILVATGTYINVSSWEPLNYVLTIFWVVGIMNSLNMLDNMDAITGTVSISIIIAVMSVMFAHHEVHSVYFIVAIGVMGAIIGFLRYNWHPSKMYMGDTGSMFLGVFLSALGVKYLWNAHHPSGDFLSARNVIVPVMIFIMPIIDTTIVVVNRLSRGQSPYIGGKDHTTHALAYLGFSDRKVAFVFFAISFVSLSLIMFTEKYVKVWNHYYTLGFAIYFFTLLIIFFRISKKNPQH